MATPKTHTRYAFIEVTVTEDWLTADGECTIQEGWGELVKQLKVALPRCMNRHGYRNPDVKVSFVDWKEADHG